MKLSLAQAVLASSLPHSEAGLEVRCVFEAQDEAARRASIQRKLTPRTSEAKVLARQFGCKDTWHWICEHALIRRRIRPHWEPLRSQSDVLKAMRSVLSSLEHTGESWKALVSTARRLEEPVL